MRLRRQAILGAVVGLVSLAASAYAASLDKIEQRLLATRPETAAPIPKAYLPAGVLSPSSRPPLTPEQRILLRSALWQNPLDQRLVNFVYVDLVRGREGGAGTLKAAAVLGRLGWRFTPAQQNLMVRAALERRFPEVVDRADSLLRRQKLTDQAIAMLTAMEGIPSVHNLVVRKLSGRPMWRQDYLLRIGAQSSPQLLDARVKTLHVLLASPQGVSRTELAPALDALVATGRGLAAYALWELKAGKRTGANLVRDPRFQAAASSTGDPFASPFEWRMHQDLGYSADISSQGVTISWDGRSVPVFLNQLVPVAPGGSYVLKIEGHSDSGKLSELLSPSIGCGQVNVGFTAGEEGNGVASFRSGPVPADCRLGNLSISGAIDSGARAATIDIGQMHLQRAK